jgi:Spy/CpxP family protein refolding chaperone
MNKKRYAHSTAVAAGIVFLFAAPGLACADSAPQSAVQTSKAAMPVAQGQGGSLPLEDFAGLTYTDEQRAEIDKIQRDTESRKNLIIKDEKLTADQKDAMLVGYARLEYESIFNVLSPEQQKQVQQRIRIRRAAGQAARMKQPPAK